MPAAALSPYICMALLAQLRSLFIQQCCMVRAMHPVTQCAVFADRIMFPQEGAAFFLVTAETIVVECHLVEVCIAGAPVWIMAIGAGGVPISEFSTVHIAQALA